MPTLARMEPEVRDDVRVEQMRMLFETPFPGMLLATAFAFALAWHMRGAVPDATLGAWLGLKCAVVLPRMAHAFAFGQRRGDSLSSLAWVAAIAAFAIHADWRACSAYTGAMLLPVTLYFLWRGDAFGLYGAASIGTFMLLLFAAARRSERHVVELLALRFRNAALTGQLRAALEKTEQESRSKDV